MATELLRNAIFRARKSELDTWQRALDIGWLNSRMEDGGMGRCLALIQKEAEMEKDFQERTDHASIVNNRARRETSLGFEVAKVRREEVNHLQRRHYLRERDQGLVELQRKLQAGYNCKDLQQQILHKEYKTMQDKAIEAHTSAIIAKSSDINEIRIREEKEKMARHAAYMKDLQQQLVMRQRQRQCQYEDTLIEKKMLEEVMRSISDEDKRELEKKRVQTERSRHEMHTFAQARDAWHLKQRAVMVNEEIELEKQRQAVADRTSAILAEKARILKVKEEINEKITAKIRADEAARLEREEIIKMLQQQELFEKNIQDELAEKRKLERMKADTMQALTQQMTIKQKQEKEQRALDLKSRLETEAKAASGNDAENQKERKKKEMRKNYAIELRRQMEDNVRRREIEARAEQARVQAVWDYHKSWDKEVEQEREKIVEEHVPQLLGFLQAGVIKKKDLPAVRAGANKREDLAKLDIESMAVSNRPKRFAKCNAQCLILREY